ncbi:hypothetical protein D0T49_07670 [Paludibacter sp. 221]|uniref:murein L,D-transpeptidase catalytic domain family protein n=1 Tax=Paludibacter sp. 221 TaxID=2302939 RepID=UPI0013D19581|nr:murein L,D-transpeptidase catalytic domain family protein [Paludibacter sp. 221]NDV46924.1 hypothetical protein [Paludibacter sp. 221]
MNKYILILFLLIFPFVCTNAIKEISPNQRKFEIKSVYSDLNLNGLLDYKAFEQAYMGFENIKGKKKDILTLIDFSKPSTEERLFVIDMKQKKVLYKTHVSHGKNSGGNYATSFSNKLGSNQSSLGFFLTEGTYQGKNGYSLVLCGLEKGINDRAKDRAIVVHGADYSNPSFIKSAGRLGRSQGCPALPQAISKEVIDLIKGGSVLFIYADDSNYLTQSDILSMNR